jgi:hypothetical protein
MNGAARARAKEGRAPRQSRHAAPERDESGRKEFVGAFHPTDMGRFSRGKTTRWTTAMRKYGAFPASATNGSNRPIPALQVWCYEWTECEIERSFCFQRMA